ncbi:Cys-tRNA(Pro) deacylase YbaK [Lactococcus cremoris]|uniref:Cys-tRNA(Pro) deacylase YbaK n=1 Tax=Lactococcus lactis subsp. cremoris TaxID=1359 RepID=A0A166JM62_LACLC|nr:YbaK/EbsC family protein [Lactococcus cremoris]KZK06410.1 Cys-tRNA(Pro) deacylase YbaK [Lactococcus cremoris]
MINLEELFTKNKIYFELYRHSPIYTNEDAVIMKRKYGFQGTETKSLFLKDKSENNYIFFTFTTERTDFKALKKITGQKLSVESTEVMENTTKQKAGAVSPFGYSMNVPIIVDKELLLMDKLVFAPGRPDQTMVVKSNQLFEIIELLNIDYYLA